MVYDPAANPILRHEALGRVGLGAAAVKHRCSYATPDALEDVEAAGYFALDGGLGRGDVLEVIAAANATTPRRASYIVLTGPRSGDGVVTIGRAFTVTIDVASFGSTGAALQKAVDYAKTFGGPAAGNLVISLGGRDWALETPLLLTGLYNAAFVDGSISPDPAFPSSEYLVRAVTNTGRVTFRGVNVFAGGACNGFLFDTVNACEIVGCKIFGAKIGVRAMGASNPNLRIENSIIQFSMNGVWIAPPGRKNNIGLWLATYDAYVRGNTIATYETNVLLDTSFGGLIMTGNHPWGTREDITTVASIADNGAGRLRVVCAAAHGFANNDPCRVGTAGAVKALGLVSVVNATTFDLPDVAFSAGLAVAGDLVSLLHIALRATASAVDATPDIYQIADNYFDTACVILEDSFNGQFTDNYFHSNAACFMVATRANTTAAAGRLEPNMWAREPVYTSRIGTAGTWASPTGVIGAGSVLQFGTDLPVGRGRLAFGKGSATVPALRFDDDATGAKSGFGVWSAGVNKLNFGWAGMIQWDAADGTQVMGHTAALTAGFGVASQLQLFGGTGIAGLVACRFSANNLGPQIQIGKGRAGTIGGVTACASGDELGTLRWFGADGVDLVNTAATLRAEAAGAYSATSTPGRLVAATTPTSATAATDRFSVEADGRVAVLTGPIELTEIAAPAAPAANKAFLYVDDSGGKTRLMVRFPTGAAAQLAIEP